MVMPDPDFSPLQYLHHFILRIEVNVWIDCGRWMGAIPFTLIQVS